MAAPSIPAAVATTKPGSSARGTTVPVKPRHDVTYSFACTTSDSVNLPYVVAIDGKVVPAHAKKPAKVRSRMTLDKNRKKVVVPGTFTLTGVDEGARVSLYLNSDAPANRRKTPVYEVIVGTRPVLVLITEKPGKHHDAPVPVRVAPTAPAPAVDEYEAALTGDIWMMVSHKYGVAEVDPCLPAGCSPAVRAAVKSIYSGLSSHTLVIREPAAAGQNARGLTVRFADSNNPQENITRYSLRADSLPRVYPGGYAALFSSALENGISSMTLSSCWRPMVGSIVHRMGLGLDVSILGGTVLNRQELRRAFSGKHPSKQGNHDDTDNVTDAEVKAFGEYESAIVAAKKADADVVAARRTLSLARSGHDVLQIQQAKQHVVNAETAKQRADASEATKRNLWHLERDAGEPGWTRLFRASLLKCVCVKQLFDPWFMDVDAKDGHAPHPNMQNSANDNLHAHHLHITVDESMIL